MVGVEKIFLRQRFYAGCLQGVGKEKWSVAGKEKVVPLGHRPYRFEVEMYCTYAHLHKYCSTYRFVEDKIEEQIFKNIYLYIRE